MPAVSLTENIVRSLEIKGFQYDVYDEVESSLIVRVNAKGSKTYTVRYSRGKRIAIGTFGELPLAVARKKARELSVAADNGQIIKTANKLTTTKDITVRQFIEDIYLPYLEANHEDGIKTYKRLAKHFFPTFGNYKMAVTPPLEVEKWKNKRIKEISPRTKKPISKSTVNRDIGAFKGVFEKAVEWECITSNPIKDVQPFELAEDAVVRYLDFKTEEPAFYNALENLPIDMFRTKVTLGIKTGARKSEIRKLKLNRIDLRENSSGIFITGKTSKSKKNRLIPLTNYARNVLYIYLKNKFPDINLSETYYSVKPEHDQFIFTDENGVLVESHKKQWKTFKKKAGIINFRWHDMRHDFASKFIMKTGDLYTCSKLLGHSTTQVTEKVYAHLCQEYIAEKIRMLG